MNDTMTRLLRPRAKLSTPWGEAYHVEEIADGIHSVTTASHGGLRLSEAAQKRLPADVLSAFMHGPGWAEEDCEVPIVLTLLDMMPGDQGRMAALAIAMKCERYRAAVPHLEEKTGFQAVGLVDGKDTQEARLS